MKSVNDLLDLNGQHVLITGASGTIGRGLARRLAEAGASVALHYRSHAEGLTDLLDELGEQALPVCADLSTADGVTDLFNSLDLADFHLTGIVNNAADQSVAGVAEIAVEDWRSMMATNLDAVFLLCQQGAQRMSNGGSLVNISSIESLDPAAGHVHYATSKAGLNMLTRALALELGHQGIRVNSISPGLIRRDGIETDWPEGVERWQERAPLRRLGEAEDVADAALFLLSDAARWVSGSNLVVDGGMTAQSKW